MQKSKRSSIWDPAIVRTAIRDALLKLHPVSYTHLTLPTIYSV